MFKLKTVIVAVFAFCALALNAWGSENVVEKSVINLVSLEKSFLVASSDKDKKHKKEKHEKNHGDDDDEADDEGKKHKKEKHKKKDKDDEEKGVEEEMMGGHGSYGL